VDFALFMVEALGNDALIHPAASTTCGRSSVESRLQRWQPMPGATPDPVYGTRLGF
jgi:hypothetical protein